MSHPLVRALLCSTAVLLACTAEEQALPASVWKLSLLQAPAAIAPGASGSVQVLLTENGKPAAKSKLNLVRKQGPLTLGTTMVQTNAQGVATVDVQAGAWPVPHAFAVLFDEEPLLVDVPVTAATPATTTPFGAVNAYMLANEITGSTEDLAPTPDGKHFVVGIPGKLLYVSVDGKVEEWPLKGTVQQPLGLSFAPDGALWVADSKAKALVRVDSDGAVTQKLTEIDGVSFKQPNDLAVLPNGVVILSDPCLGKLVRYDPATGQATTLVQLDLKTQGGPNGVAVAADGETIWFTTENTSLLCTDFLAEIGDKLGSLWSVPQSGGTTPTQHLSGLGIFGDGLALDEDGVVFATFDDFDAAAFQLKSSDVVAFDPARPQLGGIVVLRATDRLYANVAFGRGEFGKQKLYAALLTVEPFTDPQLRGLEVFAGPVVPGLALTGSDQ